MIEFLMETIVWLFDIFVFAVVLSLVAHVAMPGKFKLLHNIYRVILDFDIDEEEL